MITIHAIGFLQRLASELRNLFLSEFKAPTFFFSLSLFILSVSSFAQQKKTFENLAKKAKTPDSAIYYYKKALGASTNKGIDSLHFSLGKQYVVSGKLELARALADSSIAAIQKSKNNRLLAGFYNLKAATHHHQNQFDTALTYYLKAIKILEQQNDSLKAASIRFNIGNIFLSFQDYAKAEEQFEAMLSAILKYNDSTYLSGVLSALSAAQFELGKLDLSEESAKKALQISGIRKDILGQMLALRQLGQLEKSKNKLDASIQYFEKALFIAEKIQQPYYLALIQMNLCDAYQKNGMADEAISAGLASLQFAKNPGFATQLTSVYRSLSEAFSQKDDYSNAYKYLKKLAKINDEELNKENKGIANELMVKYETEKKDRQILQQKLSLKTEKAQTQFYISIAIVALLGVLFLIGLLLLRSKLNKSRIAQIEQQKQQAILMANAEGEERERLRLSTAIHDGLSNILFNCKLSLSTLKETLPPETANQLQENIKQIDSAREESRLIAHNLMPPQMKENSLPVLLEKYIEQLNTSIKQVRLLFQTGGEENNLLSNDYKTLLFRIVQELVGNSLKHANASEIAIQLFFENSGLRITIEDDGVGFDLSTLKKGQGLTSISARLELINGSMEIESSVDRGTFVNLNILV